jgi:hypothetical protein
VEHQEVGCPITRLSLTPDTWAAAEGQTDQEGEQDCGRVGLIHMPEGSQQTWAAAGTSVEKKDREGRVLIHTCTPLDHHLVGAWSQMNTAGGCGSAAADGCNDKKVERGNMVS